MNPANESETSVEEPQAQAQPIRAMLEEGAVVLLLTLLMLQSISLLYGQAPMEVFRALFEGTWGTGYGIGQVLFKTTPLIFTGLSVAVAFRAGLFNVGAEGQSVLGALAMGWLGTILPATLHTPLGIGLCLLAGAMAGAFWGGLAGVLKATFKAHEVITTIMLNFLAMALSSYLLVNFWAVKDTLHTSALGEGLTLPRFEASIAALQGSALNFAFPLALLMVGGVWVVLFRLTFGFELRTLGLSPGAAHYSGLNTAGLEIKALALAGALAGLVGANFVLGYKHYYEEGFSGGVGFLGIAVALLGRAHPLGVVFAALFFGTLQQGGLAVNALIPKDSMDVLQAVVIFAVAGASGRSLLRRGA